MEISGWMLLMVLLLLLLVSGYLIYCLGFTARLVKALRRSRLSAQPLSFHSVPYPFQSQYCELQKLILSLIQVSHSDALTQLPNRVGLKQGLQNQFPLDKGTILLIDIHRFRHINDVFGFAFGDHLLKAVAQRLQTWIDTQVGSLDSDVDEVKGSQCILARMEGDEFILCIDREIAKPDVFKFKAFLEQEFSLDDIQVLLRFHIGILNLAEHSPFICPEDSLKGTRQDKLSLLLKRIDLALICAKSLGDQVAWYSTGDDRLKLREHRLLSQLPKALKEGELFLEYQPKFNVHSADYQQVESLVRWNHPEFGVISPVEFIPLAESAGVIDLISYWALDLVLKQQKEWQLQGLELNSAVNLSSQDIINPGLYRYVEGKLSEYGVSPKRLTIEITESALMQDLKLAITSLQKLNTLGVKLAIDDFGTGHSSLAYLKYLPIHEVKIDKAFICGIEKEGAARSIMQACISLAKNLDFDVTVEGVEDEAIAELLISMGVDTLQGQLYASPMTSHVLLQWLKP